MIPRIPRGSGLLPGESWRWSSPVWSYVVLVTGPDEDVNGEPHTWGLVLHSEQRGGRRVGRGPAGVHARVLEVGDDDVLAGRRGLGEAVTRGVGQVLLRRVGGPDGCAPGSQHALLIVGACAGARYERECVVLWNDSLDGRHAGRLIHLTDEQLDRWYDSP